MTPLLVILAIGALVVFALYNMLIGKKNAVEHAFATIDVFLQRRFDLIPNLVATVGQYARHEADTLTRIAELRAGKSRERRNSDEQVAVDNELSAGLGRLFATIEAYPELQASRHFLQLQRALNEAEEQIAAARRAFNAAVTDFNNAVEMFPTSLVAGAMGYTRRTLLATPESERVAADLNSAFKR